MQITVLGIVLLPLSLIWALRPVRLLQLALVAAVFEAAAALILGGNFGLQPAMVPGLLFMAYVFLQYALGMRYPGEAIALRTLMPLLALMCYAAISIWLLPDAFAGKIMVWPQRAVDPLLPGKVALQFNFGNVTQLLYLSFNIVAAAAVAVFMTRDRIPYRSIIGAYMLGGYVVVGLAFWQFANRVAGVPFPDEVLQSNPGWAIVEQSVGTVPRVQGPFSEPAALAVYMSGVTICALWLSVRGYRTMRPNLLFALGFATTLLSTSTTGIATMVAGLPVTLLVGSIGGDPKALGRIARTLGLLLLGGVMLVGPVFLLRPSLIASVDEVVESTLSKGQSESYEERSAADAAAVATIDQTYGLGVGWGSARSSSLLPGLLANGGLFGLAMVLWLALRVVLLGREGRRRARGHPGQILVDGFSASLCSQLGAALLSAPMINSLAFFLQLGCVVGVLARMVQTPGMQRAPQPAGTWRAGYGTAFAGAGLMASPLAASAPTPQGIDPPSLDRLRNDRP